IHHNPHRPMLLLKKRRGIVMRSWQCWRMGHEHPIGRTKDKPSGGVALDLHATFVHRTMVRRAEQREIRKLGLTAARPMDHVMGIDEACRIASRKTAAPITL